jgi:hypothetical protein
VGNIPHKDPHIETDFWPFPGSRPSPPLPVERQLQRADGQELPLQAEQGWP